MSSRDALPPPIPPAIDWALAPIAAAKFGLVRKRTGKRTCPGAPQDSISAINGVIGRISKKQRVLVRRRDVVAMVTLGKVLDEAITVRARLSAGAFNSGRE